MSQLSHIEPWRAVGCLSVILGWTLVVATPSCTADLTEECLGGPCAVGTATTSAQDSGEGAGGQGQACLPNEPSGELPCDVSAVLAAKCATCHAPNKLTYSGAAFALVTYADTQAPFDERPRWQRMREVIQPDGVPHMPWGSAPPLTASETQVLEDWFEACAPPRPAGVSCP